jgi:hypothetical protein
VVEEDDPSMMRVGKEVALVKRIILLVTVALLMTAFAAVAQAQPADQSPVGGPGAHPHHIHTGNGGCVGIDGVLFEPDDRGLHQGSNASGGHARGPFHGPCH